MPVYRVIKAGVTHWVTGGSFDEASRAVGCSKVIGGDCTFKQYIAPKGVTDEAHRLALSGGATPAAGTTGKPLTPEEWAIAKEDVKQYTEKTITTPSGEKISPAQDYIQYKKFIKTEEGKGLPEPTSIEDYLKHATEWATQFAEQKEIEQTELQRQYNLYKAYMRAYGELGGWQPVDFDDWLNNREAADQQLAGWQEEHGLQLEEELAVEEYAISPEEAARRQEEAYAESRYAAEERYREAPMYGETFAQWGQGLDAASQALQAYIKGQYPSLQAEYKAEVGRLGGFPTREEARAEAGRRETGWKSWLGERMPETTQEYYAQRPAQRGERLWMQAPSLRKVNW